MHYYSVHSLGAVAWHYAAATDDWVDWADDGARHVSAADLPVSAVLWAPTIHTTVAGAITEDVRKKLW